MTWTRRALAQTVPKATLWFLAAVTTVSFVFPLACTARRNSVPDPRAAAEAYAAAAERADADAIYDMLTKRSQATASRVDVRSSVSFARAELADQAKEVRSASGSTNTVARIRLESGVETSLTFKDGRFWVATSGLIPGGGSTPSGALVALRDALRFRSYPALIQLLTPSVRTAVEEQLRGIIEALEDPAAQFVPSATGDEIEVRLPKGHRAKLRKDHGTWFVETFE